MWKVSRPRLLGAAVACALTCFAGCGDDSPSTQAKATPQPAQFDPKAVLIRDDEEPGFKVDGEALTNTQPFPLPPAGAKQLQDSGFISSTYRPLKSADGAGASSITLFKTADGAAAWLQHETTDAGIKEQIP